MRVHVDPAMAAWAPAPHGDAAPWTGHQPWLWHPGILAKYLAADALASGLPYEAAAVHLVVDHDTRDALRLDVPQQSGEVLTVRRWPLAPTRPDVPAACQPPADVDDILTNLHREQRRNEAIDLSRLIAAFDRPEPRQADHLGRQVALVLQALTEPWLDRPMHQASSAELYKKPWFTEELHTLLQDARSSIRHYNAAVATHPAAGVAPLRIEPDRVELPVWLLGWGQPRRRLFADLADTRPWLTTEDGEPVDPENAWLAPKALWMTALLRHRTGDCLGFIHGTGGGAYDRVMEAWWQAWRDEPLAPQAVVTADVTMAFDAPASDRAAFDRAVWLRHHLPHNLDRVPSIAAAHPDLVREKRELLEHMHNDRNPRRRRAAFDRVHTINAALADAHHILLDRATKELQIARIGLTNAAVAAVRDWCFALYPEQTLRDLRHCIRASVGATSTP